MGTKEDVRRLMTPDEVTQRLHVSLHVLRRMRSEGTGPKYYRLGHKTVRYCPESVEQWLREREEVR